MGGGTLSWTDDILSLAADWWWEQDAAFRFTRLWGDGVEGGGVAVGELLGKPRWEIGLQLVGGSWDWHRADLEARRPFRDLLVYRPLADGNRRYLCISGAPVYDAAGRFQGYRGFGRDVTALMQPQQELERLKAALDAYPHPVFITDVARMQIVYVNDSACRMSGYSREELLALPPEVAAQLPRKSLLQIYAQAAASENGFTLGPVLLSSRDGSRRGWWEIFWQSLELEGRQFIFTTSREVTERKLAHEAAQRTARTLTVLSTINEAMLRATSPDELFQQACNIAVEAGQFIGAAILLRAPGSTELKLAAATGSHVESMRAVSISIDPNVPEGRGLAGTAFRSGQPCTTDEFLTDERTRHWRAHAEQLGIRAGAAIPLLRKQTPFGVMLLYSADRRAFDDEIIALLQRMAANISYALDVFEQEAQRVQAEEALRRSEEKYRSILDNIEDAYYEVDLEGRLTFFNNAFCRLLGYAEHELLGTSYQALMRPETASMIRTAFNGVYRSGQSLKMLHWELLRKDGGILLVEGSVQLIRGTNGVPAGFRGIIRDLTERKREERLLALEHAVTRLLAESGETRRTLRGVARLICQSEQWAAGGYYQLDPASGSARLLAGWRQPEFRTEWLGEGFAEVPAGGLISAVAESGEPLWVENLADDPRATWAPPKEAEKLARLFFPVRVEGETLGVFTFVTGSSRPPEPRLLQTALVIGDQVGQFLQRKQVEQGLRESEARFRSLTALSSDWYWEQDAEFRFTRLEGRHMVGDESLEGENWLGRRRWETGLVPDEGGSWREHIDTLRQRQPFKDFILRRTMADGSVRYISVSGEPILDGQGKLLGYRGVGRDVTDSKRAEEQIRYLATHDSLTELPNRVLFGQLLTAAIKTAKRQARGFTVMFIDLDHFKLVNDTLGHEAGDRLLREVAQRLKRTLRASDTVARLGGDEFVVLLQRADTRESATKVAQKILAALSEPIVIQGQECRVTASIGICMYPLQAHDEESLMLNADTAMYLAKEAGKSSFRFYDPALQHQSAERMALEKGLQQALENGQFVLHYQAKLDLKTNRIAGVEALLRWNHPERGLIPPGAFIPLAEESGLIVPIGRWVLQAVCRQNMEWLDQGLPPVVVAVNLSPRQFQDDGLLDDIANALRASGMPPQLLELELTEGMLLENSRRTLQTLNAIKALGIRITMDDFGVGYSSLGQLRGFPIDTLKIDRSFIQNLPDSSQDRAITRAIVALAKSLELQVIAEGVETVEQERFLREIACDQSQGYYFSKPVAADEFAELLRKTSTTHPVTA